MDARGQAISVRCCHKGHAPDRSTAERNFARLLRHALTVLVNLEHRGASGAEKNTGDGAGLTSQLPHAFFVDAVEQFSVLGSNYPAEYGRTSGGVINAASTFLSRTQCHRGWRASSAVLT